MIQYLKHDFISDKDECIGLNNCSQLCTNTEGSYTCSCNIGFQLAPASSTRCISKFSWYIIEFFE